MALLFIDGFDHYQTSDISKKYQLISSTPTILPTGGRRGGGCISYNYYKDSVTRFVPTSTNIIVGAAIAFSTGNDSSNVGLFTLWSGHLEAARLEYINGSFIIKTSLGFTTGSAASMISTFQPGVWNYIEWKMQIADSIPANTCVVRVNGVEVLNLPAGTDTRYVNYPTTMDGVEIGQGDGILGSYYMSVDDFYVCNTQGAGPTDFLGDIRVDTLLPNLDGTYNDGVPNTGSDNWSILDNVPPAYSEYVNLTDTNEKQTCEFTSLSPITSQTIYGVQVDLDSAKSESGTKIIAPLALSNSTLTEATSFGLTNNYVYATGIFTTDPNTSIAWNESGINAAQFGIIIK